MQKLLLLSIFSLLFGTSIAQHDHHSKINCSKAKFFNEYYKNAKEVVQTPLLFDYDVKFYFLDIEVDNNSIYISGEVTIMAEVTANELDTFAVEFLDIMTVDEITYNGNAMLSSHTNDELFIFLPETLNQGDLFSVNIQYHGTPPTGGFFAGVSNGSSWGKNVTWTLSEPFAARSWFPVKQVLEDKADSAWVFLTTSENNMAGSNGLLTSITPMPDNKLRYEWKTNYPIDFYLISFAVSEYQEYNIYSHPEELNGDSVLIQNFIYDSPGYLDQWQEDIDITADMIEVFSELYAPYPFHEEKYGHCVAPMGGGMEHQTMTTLDNFNFELVAHELGHMWFGDNITCATWNDIWINEGFATYTPYLAYEHLYPSDAAEYMNAIHNDVLNQPGGSTYIPDDEIYYENVWRIFSWRLTYAKGAAILHMIRFELQNDDLFFQVLHDYTDQFADSTATGLDFMGVLNETSGMDFTNFFNQWYFGEGYPIYSIVWSQGAGMLNLEISQTTSMPSATPLFKMLMAYKLSFYDQTDTTIYLYQTENTNTFQIPISNDIGLITIDPDNWVLNQTGSITTFIDETKNPVAFTFGPNPVRDKLNLYFANFDGNKKEIQLMDISGAEVKSINSIMPREEIDISDLSKGTYLINLSDGKNQFSKKFVKVN